jgi:LuxR family maltose regulon positive regulatory protein
VEALCVRALLHEKRDEKETALEIISQAIALAKPGRFIRVFVDMGPSITSLLKPLARRGQHGAFTRDILTAYYEDSMASGGWNDKVANTGQSYRGNPAESLTRKEMEALQLLAQGLYNREIADRLFVSVETVKTHLKHIYRKLNVGTRRQAVTRAKAMGVLGDRRQADTGMEPAA